MDDAGGSAFVEALHDSKRDAAVMNVDPRGGSDGAGGGRDDASETPLDASQAPPGAPGGGGSEANFPPPPASPTQLDPCGIRFDFNDGCRVAAPMGPDVWRIRLFDLDTGNVLFQTTPDFRGGFVASAKKYYVRFRIEAWKGDKLVFAHDYDASGRQVLIAFPVGTLGDTIAWISYAVRFADAHECRLTIAMSGRLISLFAGAYPEIRFIEMKAVKPEDYYATYRVGLFFNDVARVHQPIDFRHVGLHRTAAHILGLDPSEAPPRLAVKDEGRPIAEKYVVIATQATSQCKYWNNPYGWREIIQFLKQAGYRVVCIDQKPVNGRGIVWNHLPAGAEDQTGDRPLAERVNWIRHAEFFVGLCSGLSWLAWAAGARVVMIGGFALPNTEFETPWRVINYHACVGCWNDPTLRFDHRDFLWCPRHAGTPRQFECTSLITAAQVKQTIRRIPGFAERAAETRGEKR
jgi:autotransporter strand-loop-strand O-heptosyltransferase